MPTLRERFAGLMLGKEIKQLEQAFGTLWNAYLEGPYQLPPEQLMAQLKEYDPGLLMDTIQSMGWDAVGALGSVSTGDEDERMRSVKEARRQFCYDPLTDFALSTWTNFGFGERIEITPHLEEGETENDATEVWSEFWTADRNRPVLGQRRLHELSNTILQDGDLFLVFFISTLDGKATVRTIPTEQITEIVTDPGDEATPLFYKRRYTDGNGTVHTVYYPDWLAGIKYDRDGKPVANSSFEVPDTYTDPITREVIRVIPGDAIRADKANPKTFVCILHLAHNVKTGRRGWPIGVAAAPWTRAHKKFREDRSTVAAAVATFVNKIRVEGGSRATKAVQQRMESVLTQAGQFVDRNPTPAAGASMIMNKSTDIERMPLTTGAGDAKTDGEGLLLMAGLGMKLYPHWLGAGDAYRLATATSMEGPMLRNFSRYQLFWSSAWEDIAKLIFIMAERYGRRRIDSYSVNASTDKLIETDLGAVTTALGATFRDIINPLVTAGIMDHATAAKLAGSTLLVVLQTLGVADAGDIVADLLSGEVPEPEPAPEPPEQPGQVPPGGQPAPEDQPDGQPADQEEPAEDTTIETAADGADGHEPIPVNHTCPLCGFGEAFQYAGHPENLYVCAGCLKTYNAKVTHAASIEGRTPA